MPYNLQFMGNDQELCITAIFAIDIPRYVINAAIVHRYLLITSIALLLANCATEVEVGGISEVPNPTVEMSQQSGKSLSALERGHEIYMLRCGECHAYPLPEQAAAQDFAKTLPKMIEHAGLESSDCAHVLDYILAVKTTQKR